MNLEGVSAARAKFITLPVTVQKIASSVDALDSRLRALEATADLEVGGRIGYVDKRQKKPDQEKQS